MTKIQSDRRWAGVLRRGGGRRLGGFGLAGTLALLLVATLVQATGSTASASAAGSSITVHGWPTQAGLTVYSSYCVGGDYAQEGWDFYTGPSPAPYGPTAVGWQPTPGLLGSAYGVEAYTAEAMALDIFQIEVNSPAGATKGFAEVDYYPTGEVYDWFRVHRRLHDHTGGLAHH